MKSLIQSEFIKGRRTFGRKSIMVFPLVVSLLAIFLVGGQLTQVGAYSWWYMILLPVCLSLLCMNITDEEMKSAYFNILTLPISKAKQWRAKIITVSLYILAANLFLFGFTTIGGVLLGSQYPTWVGISAALVLTATVVWQIPFTMYLAKRFHSFVAFFISIGLNIICCSQPVAGSSLWVIPFAIPARLMAPILEINPNGIPLQIDSPLHNSNVILPGILITATLFISLTIFTSKWFENRED